MKREQSHDAIFAKVLDGRKQPIRGLWKRNERFYAQLTFEDANTGVKLTRRVPLTGKDGKAVRSSPEAREAMERLKVKRADNALPVLRRTPKFSEFIESYLAHIGAGTTEKVKKGSTVKKERSSLAGWGQLIGHLRLDQIRRTHVNAYIARRSPQVSATGR